MDLRKGLIVCGLRRWGKHSSGAYPLQKAQWRRDGMVGKRRVNRGLKVGVHRAEEKTSLAEESWDHVG